MRDCACACVCMCGCVGKTKGTTDIRNIIINVIQCKIINEVKKQVERILTSRRALPPGKPGINRKNNKHRLN